MIDGRSDARMDTMKRLEKWFFSHCDNDWEHDNRIEIYNLDNPGWGVKIDLSNTLLEDRAFETIAWGDGEDREATWISCYKQDRYFVGLGSYDKLDAILCEFLDWADANTDTSPWDSIVTEIGAKLDTISKGHPCAAREQLRELFREIDRIPTEHPGKNGLLKKFDSVWKEQWKDGGERKTTTQE